MLCYCVYYIHNVVFMVHLTYPFFWVVQKFKKNIKSTDELKGLDTLRWDDQQKIKAKFGEGEGVDDDDDDIEFEVGDVSVEYARSGRSSVSENANEFIFLQIL